MKLNSPDKEINRFLSIVESKNITFGSIESFTGGLFASTMAEIPGISSYFIGSVVTYNTRIKTDIVGVDKNIIDKYTVVSKEVSLEMARHGKELLNVDLCVSFTGNAGPGVCKGDKSVGLFYIGISYKGEEFSYEFKLDDERNIIRKKAVLLAIEKIIEIIY